VRVPAPEIIPVAAGVNTLVDPTVIVPATPKPPPIVATVAPVAVVKLKKVSVPP
jgi:hypothetical protein